MDKNQLSACDRSFIAIAVELTQLARKIIAGSYDASGRVFHLADDGRQPREVAELAEVFGMMVVKVEAREFALEQTIDELRRSKDELELACRARAELGRLFILFALFMGIYNFIIEWSSHSQYVQANVGSAVPIIGMIFCLVLTGLAILMIRGTRLPLRHFGLTWDGAGRSCREALGWTAVFIGGLIAFKAWAAHNVPEMAGKPLLDLAAVNGIFWAYLLVAPLQEFVARGVLQSSVSRLLGGRYATFWAIMTSSVLFGVTHTFYSLPLALSTMAASFFWGWLYSRHGTLIGCAISHFLIGSALVLLDFWPYLIS